jgi:hypothetical protein
LEGSVFFDRAFHALSSHKEIAERYGQAKACNRPDNRTKPTPKGVYQRVIDLQRKVEQLEALINRYDERWAHYARNAAVLGNDSERLDQAIAASALGCAHDAPEPYG